MYNGFDKVEVMGHVMGKALQFILNKKAFETRWKHGKKFKTV